MTKKEQAKQKLRSFLEGDLRVECLNEEEEEYIRSLIHAIDAADREERGVMFTHEVSFCGQCEELDFDRVTCLRTLEITNNRASPDWCPRRKENRK